MISHDIDVQVIVVVVVEIEGIQNHVSEHEALEIRKRQRHSLALLEAQANSKQSGIFIDGDNRIYRRCLQCNLCFHANCAKYDLELIITKELRDTICETCTTATYPSTKQLLKNSLLSSNCSQTKCMSSQPSPPAPESHMPKNLQQDHAECQPNPPPSGAPDPPPTLFTDPLPSQPILPAVTDPFTLRFQAPGVVPLFAIPNPVAPAVVVSG
ncbi:hypothetical protein DPMN_168542 [Dreissena polymorpha]|uniref:Zinc finger PHD-type domain-containing protein n=1 Tax=Dreissena polymorpha TaxID=45954 RepID=A0A9D4F0U8_DREPO|nr:hypothetical protein DPMN_168542 [Dreissena polymorpha]